MATVDVSRLVSFLHMHVHTIPFFRKTLLPCLFSEEELINTHKVFGFQSQEEKRLYQSI